MTWAVFLALLGVAVVVAAAWLLGRPRSPERFAGLGELEDADAPVGRARHLAAGPGFGAQTRGYRMDQVDTVRRLARGPHRRARPRDRAAARRGACRPPPARRPRPSTPARSPSARPAEDEPPPRPGPAAGRDEPPAVGRPVPLRRSDLWAPLAYLLLAGWVLAGLIGNLRTGYLSQGVQDQQAFEWYFGAAAHNLTSLSNPLFSDLQNFPAGVNLMANAAVLGPRHPARPADPARRAVGHLPRRRAARPGPHGLRVVLAVPPVPGRAPARRRHRGGLHRLRARHGLARQRPPELRGAVPRAADRRPGAAPRAGPPPGARRRRCSACSPPGRCSSARRCCC